MVSAAAFHIGPTMRIIYYFIYYPFDITVLSTYQYTLRICFGRSCSQCNMLHSPIQVTYHCDVYSETRVTYSKAAFLSSRRYKLPTKLYYNACGYNNNNVVMLIEPFSRFLPSSHYWYVGLAEVKPHWRMPKWQDVETVEFIRLACLKYRFCLTTASYSTRLHCKVVQ